jgi:hypothetical protein
MLNQGGNFSFGRLLPGVKANGLEACRFGDGIASPVFLGDMRPVVQLNERHNRKIPAFADHEIRNLPVEPGTDRPSCLAGQYPFVREEGSKRNLRKYLIRGESTLQAMKELRLVGGEQRLALNAPEPRVAASHQCNKDNKKNESCECYRRWMLAD